MEFRRLGYRRLGIIPMEVGYYRVYPRGVYHRYQGREIIPSDCHS